MLWINFVSFVIIKIRDNVSNSNSLLLCKKKEQYSGKSSSMSLFFFLINYRTKNGFQNWIVDVTVPLLLYNNNRTHCVLISV